MTNRRLISLTLAMAMLAGCGQAAAGGSSPPGPPPESAFAESAPPQPLAEPQITRRIFSAESDILPIPQQVLELSEKTRENSRIIRFSPEGGQLGETEWNQYTYADPRISPDGENVLFRVYSYDEGQSWSASMVCNLVTGRQRYCPDEPPGDKRFMWVGDGLIACAISTRSGKTGANSIHFFDSEFKPMEIPFPFDFKDGVRMITGVWVGEQYTHIVYVEDPNKFQYVTADFSSPTLLTLDSSGQTVAEHVFEDCYTPGNSFYGFGSSILPASDGRLLINIRSAGSDWLVADPITGKNYTVPNCYSMSVFDGVNLIYGERGSEQNGWSPAGYICTLGEDGIENLRDLPISDFSGPSPGRSRFALASYENYVYGSVGQFDQAGEYVYLFAIRDYRSAYGPQYNALYRMRTDTLEYQPVAFLPDAYRFVGLDGGGNAVVIGSFPHPETQYDQSYHEYLDISQRVLPSAISFWNERGQLLAAAAPPEFCRAGIGNYDLRELAPEDLWQLINRVYAYLFWQNGQSPESYELPFELMEKRLLSLFGSGRYIDMLKPYLDSGKNSFTLSGLSPDPDWELEPTDEMLYLDSYGMWDNGDHAAAVYIVRDSDSPEGVRRGRFILSSLSHDAELLGMAAY